MLAEIIVLVSLSMLAINFNKFRTPTINLTVVGVIVTRGPDLR